MPVTITRKGNDDNVLAQVLADGSIASSYSGNTQRAVEQAATVAAIDLAYAGSDLNMIERLALAAGIIACLFPLSFDGLGAFGYSAPDSIGPDGQSITTAITAGTNKWGAATMTQALDASATAPDVVVRLVPSALPLFAADGSEGIGSVGLALFGAGPVQAAGLSIVATNAGTYFWWARGAGGAVIADGLLAALPAFIDMKLSGAAGQYELSLPDGTVLTTAQPFTAGELNPLLDIQTTGAALGAVGRVLTAELVTDAAALSDSPYAGTGAVNACGQVI